MCRFSKFLDGVHFMSICFALCSCGSNLETECDNDCEREGQPWPRVVIGIIPPTESEQNKNCEEVEIIYQDDQGNVHVQGDSDDLESIPCTVFGGAYSDSWITTSSYLGGKDHKWVDVTVRYKELFSDPYRIEFSQPFNRCGQMIAYVIVSLNEEEKPQFMEMEYRSPCEELDI